MKNGQPPYPPDTRAKGWKFELDIERVRSSDTWALAHPEARPWLYMLWAESWMQTPCGSLPVDRTLIAARIAAPEKLWARHANSLMRGWFACDDGRLYHPVITELVLAMLERKSGDRARKAAYRQRMDASRDALSHGTDAGQTGDGHGTDATGTGTSLKTIHSEAGASGGLQPPADLADLVFALGVPLLTSAGVSDRNARSFLALQSKTHGNQALASALERCALEKPIQPVAWLQAVLKPKPTGRHAGFEKIDYKAGVTEDGFLL